MERRITLRKSQTYPCGVSCPPPIAPGPAGLRKFFILRFTDSISSVIALFSGLAAISSCFLLTFAWTSAVSWSFRGIGSQNAFISSCIFRFRSATAGSSRSSRERRSVTSRRSAGDL